MLLIRSALRNVSKVHICPFDTLAQFPDRTDITDPSMGTPLRRSYPLDSFAPDHSPSGEDSARMRFAASPGAAEPMTPTASMFRIRTPLRLAEDEAQVWQADLDALARSETQWLNLLSRDEQDRAGRFRFPIHRQRFTAGRGLLRTLLGSYLNIDPREVIFRYSEKDKPRLADLFAKSSLQFNLSHSDNVILLGFTLGRDIGVDVEKLRVNFNVLEIAERFFSESERNALAALPLSQHHQAFFNCWTRKEAFVKAVGEGLSLPLDQFDVSLAPGQSAELLATRPDPGEAARWSLWALDAGPGCAAAVVVRGSNLRILTAPVLSIMEHGL